SQVWWIALADELRPAKPITQIGFIDAVKDAFQFRQWPIQIPKAGEPTEFLEGYMMIGDEKFPITKLAVFTDGVNITVPASTEYVDQVLQKALETFYALGVREPITPPIHDYVSFLVVDMDHSIDSFFPPSVLKMISDAVPYEGDVNAFSMVFNADPLKQ